MTFSYPSVSTTANTYDAYADQSDADTYADASISAASDTWRDTTLTSTDIKARALVSATRWLDSVTWLGDKAEDDQALLWPRKNITGVDSTELPSQLQAACIELALALVDNADARTELADAGLKAIRAGSVSLDYFRPEGNTQVQTPFPAVVMALVSQWLGGSGTAVGVISTDTKRRSRLLDDPYDFSHGV
jgi:hypothetical protein